MVSRLLQRQFLRFLWVGLLNTSFGYGVFALLTSIGLRYPIAIAAATLAGVTFNFQTTGRLVFQSAPASLFWRFIAVYGVLYCINLGGVAGLLSIGFNIYLANAIVLPFLAILAFVLNRTFVFTAP